MTRLSIPMFALPAVFFIADHSALAQQAVSQYPWCLERGIGGPRSCYYTSYEQCWQEAFTRGGFCTESPYYRPKQDRRAGTNAQRHRRHRSLPAK
jgi:hypothetical protein